MRRRYSAGNRNGGGRNPHDRLEGLELHSVPRQKQLDLFVHWLRTGEEPFPFAQSVELMKMVVAGLRSRKEGGRVVKLSEIDV